MIIYNSKTRHTQLEVNQIKMNSISKGNKFINKEIFILLGRKSNLPLVEEMGEACVAGLDAASTVHGATACRPRVQDQTGEERRGTARRHRFGRDLHQGAASMLLAAHVAHFRRCVLVRHRQVQDIRSRAHVAPWFNTLFV